MVNLANHGGELARLDTGTSIGLEWSRWPPQDHAGAVPRTAGLVPTADGGFDSRLLHSKAKGS